MSRTDVDHCIRDPLFSRNRYGGPFHDLVSGSVTDIPIDNVLREGEFHRLEDLLVRYPGLALQKGRLRYRPNVVWLGVESDAVGAALTTLFWQNGELQSFESFPGLGEGDARAAQAPCR